MSSAAKKTTTALPSITSKKAHQAKPAAPVVSRKASAVPAKVTKPAPQKILAPAPPTSVPKSSNSPDGSVLPSDDDVSASTSAPPVSDLDRVVKYILEKDCKKILIMLGAGISVAAGIPDFRTPGTGLYSNLGKYNLSQPEEVFCIDKLKANPEVFFSVANDMKLWPGLFAPTHVHHFVKLLVDAGRVLRVCTQNIDTLEREAGVPDDIIVEAHGSFADAHCINPRCKQQFPMKQLRALAEEGKVPRCEKCGGVVKPDVVFFGEGLPDKFWTAAKDDAPTADLLLVIGTSLKVNPFASLADRVPKSVLRVLINNQRAGESFVFRQDVEEVKNYVPPVKAPKVKVAKPSDDEAAAGDSGAPEEEDEDEGTMPIEMMVRMMNLAAAGGEIRDVFIEGDCQKLVRSLAVKMGLGAKLSAAHTNGVDRWKAMQGYTPSSSGGKKLDKKPSMEVIKKTTVKVAAASATKPK